VLTCGGWCRAAQSEANNIYLVGMTASGAQLYSAHSTYVTSVRWPTAVDASSTEHTIAASIACVPQSASSSVSGSVLVSVQNQIYHFNTTTPDASVSLIAQLHVPQYAVCIACLCLGLHVQCASVWLASTDSVMCNTIPPGNHMDQCRCDWHRSICRSDKLCQALAAQCHSAACVDMIRPKPDAAAAQVAHLSLVLICLFCNVLSQ
jgi:hypothetical protein